MVNASADTQPLGPLLSYTRSMLEPSSEWRMLGDYAIWTGMRARAEPLQLLELIGQRVLPIPASGTRAVLHPIEHNRYFTVEGLFGFWLRADVDVIWLDAPSAETRHYSLCVGGSEGRPGTLAYAWVCPSCGTLVDPHESDVAAVGFSAALASAQAEVERFNADEALRTCRGCGAVHPRSYAFRAA